MKRFFQQFFPDAPLQEISERTALERSYFVLEQQAPKRYECFSKGVLDEVIYPNYTDPTDALADLTVRYDGLRARIYAPEKLAGNERTYHFWYVVNGSIARGMRYVYQNDKKDHRIYHYDADGALVDYRDFIYEDWGLAEIWTYDKDGVLLTKSDEHP